jgi:hypothetical protein
MRSLAVARPANCGVLLIRQLKVQAATPLTVSLEWPVSLCPRVAKQGRRWPYRLAQISVGHLCSDKHL